LESNVKKSRVYELHDPRVDAVCCNKSTEAETVAPWVKTLRYLGIYNQLTNFQEFLYSLLTAIFGEVGRIAPNVVILQLVTSNCLPASMYDTEACHLTKLDSRLLDFLIHRLLVRLLKLIKLILLKSV
jgi:hypothetical protein